jgi:hypothetical protein
MQLLVNRPLKTLPDDRPCGIFGIPLGRSSKNPVTLRKLHGLQLLIYVIQLSSALTLQPPQASREMKVESCLTLAKRNTNSQILEPIEKERKP